MAYLQVVILKFTGKFTLRKFQHMATLKFAWMQLIGSRWVDTIAIGQHAWQAIRVINWHRWLDM